MINITIRSVSIYKCIGHRDGKRHYFHLAAAAFLAISLRSSGVRI